MTFATLLALGVAFLIGLVLGAALTQLGIARQRLDLVEALRSASAKRRETVPAREVPEREERLDA